MTIEEARRICNAKGLCLCGHFETCSVCTRPESQRKLEREAEAVLTAAGCGKKFPHDIGYANMCRLCGKSIRHKPLKFKKRLNRSGGGKD